MKNAPKAFADRLAKLKVHLEKPEFKQAVTEAVVKTLSPAKPGSK